MTAPWPACVGTHEPGHTMCDGDPSGETGEERVACRWRDRCGGFKAHLESAGIGPDEYMGERELGRAEEEEFERACLGWAAEYGIVAGVPGARGPGLKPFGYRGTSSRAWRERRGVAGGAVKHFVELMMIQFPSRRAAPGTLSAPGQFIVADQRRRSRYLAIYCAGLGAKRVPVVSARPKAKARGAEIRLPTTPEAWMVRPASVGFAAVPVVDGAFRCSLGVLGRGQLGQLARVLREMSKIGELKLPEVSE